MGLGTRLGLIPFVDASMLDCHTLVSRSVTVIIGIEW